MPPKSKFSLQEVAHTLKKALSSVVVLEDVAQQAVIDRARQKMLLWRIWRKIAVMKKCPFCGTDQPLLDVSHKAGCLHVPIRREASD